MCLSKDGTTLHVWYLEWHTFYRLRRLTLARTVGWTARRMHGQTNGLVTAQRDGWSGELSLLVPSVGWMSAWSNGQRDRRSSDLAAIVLKRL